MNQTLKMKRGNWGEDLATRYLEKQGFLIIERNFHCREGEIDIIAQKNNKLHFVEVKTRFSDNFGSPEESFFDSKQKKVLLAAQVYLFRKETPEADFQIDLVAIEKNKQGKTSLRYFPNCLQESV